MIPNNNGARRCRGYAKFGKCSVLSREMEREGCTPLAMFYCIFTTHHAPIDLT